MIQQRMKKLGWLAAIGLGMATHLASAAVVYTAVLSGAAESPPNASPGTGTATVTIDTGTHDMRVQTTFSGLTGTTTSAHIHCCTAVAGVGTAAAATQVPTFGGFPLGVSAGSYDQLFDLAELSSWNPAFVTAHGGTAAGAEGAFLAGLANGQAYLNIHSNLFGGGEIRGFLAAVPNPATLVLVGIGLAALGWRRGQRS